MLLSFVHASHVCAHVVTWNNTSSSSSHMRSRVFDDDHMQALKYMRSPKQPDFHKSPQKKKKKRHDSKSNRSNCVLMTAPYVAGDSASGRGVGHRLSHHQEPGRLRLQCHGTSWQAVPTPQVHILCCEQQQQKCQQYSGNKSNSRASAVVRQQKQQGQCQQ